MDHVQRFGLVLPPKTETASIEFVKNVLDPQIDELQNQLILMQSARRAIASIFNLDRRGDDAGVFGQAADSTNRQHYEGEGDEEGKVGRLIPRSAAR